MVDEREAEAFATRALQAMGMPEDDASEDAGCRDAGASMSTMPEGQAGSASS